MLWLCFLLLPGATHSTTKELTAAVLKYIYENEQICGDPFADPDWLPAYDECTIGCDVSKYMCLLYVEKREQKCQPLPRECVDSMRRKFEWFEPETEQTVGDSNVDRFEADMLQREEAATARTTSFITEAPVVRVENDVEDPYNVQPEIYTTTTVTTRQGEYIDNESPQSAAGAYEYPIQQEMYQTTSTERATTTTTTETTTPPEEAPYINYGSSHQLSGYEQEEVTTERAVRVIPGIRINVTTQKQILVSTTTIPFLIGDNSLKESPYIMEPFAPIVSMTGSRIDLVPPPPPPDPMRRVDEQALNGMIQRFNTQDDTTTAKPEVSERRVDKSGRCCEWALNGLCDGHWQKVRKICPKSCGVLICEDIEGVTSCNRYPEIDVEECYHSLRNLRYAGVKTVQNKPLTLAAFPKTTSKRKIKKLRKKRRSKEA